MIKSELLKLLQPFSDDADIVLFDRIPIPTVRLFYTLYDGYGTLILASSKPELDKIVELK